MVVNAYGGPIIKNRPHAKHNYGPGKSRFEIDYYRQTFFQKTWVVYKKFLEKAGQEVIYSSRCFSSKYMESFGYDTCEKLI